VWRAALNDSGGGTNDVGPSWQVNFRNGDVGMTSHMPPVPPANRRKKGNDRDPQSQQADSVKNSGSQNTAEQGETANIKQNTTNKGYFHGRRMK
jgi:hypothetical protein